MLQYPVVLSIIGATNAPLLSDKGVMPAFHLGRAQRTVLPPALQSRESAKTILFNLSRKCDIVPLPVLLIRYLFYSCISHLTNWQRFQDFILLVFCFVLLLLLQSGVWQGANMAETKSDQQISRESSVQKVYNLYKAGFI